MSAALFLRTAFGCSLWGSSLIVSLAASAQVRSDPPISLNGTRELQIGAPVAQAIGQYSLEELSTGSEDEDTSACGTTSYNYPPLDVQILAVNGTIARLRIEAHYDNIPEISYRTPEGIRLGSTISEVRMNFPNAEETVEDNGGRTQIFAWRQIDRSGYLFEISPETQRVVSLAVGDRSLRWYEDCF
jgi:hypothetical protein